MTGETARAKQAVRVVRLPHAFGLPLPAYASGGAAGMDIMAAVMEPETVEPSDILLVPTGLRVAVPQGFELALRPRSGLALKHRITLQNSPGTIDADFRGEVQVILRNEGVTPFIVERGMRIAQGVLAPVYPAVWEEVEALDDTERSDGGFGSTGTHVRPAAVIRETPDV